MAKFPTHVRLTRDIPTLGGIWKAGTVVKVGAITLEDSGRRMVGLNDAAAMETVEACDPPTGPAEIPQQSKEDSMITSGLYVMRHWARLKAENRNCLLLFRIGDFYECYREDAEAMGKLIGLTITWRNGVAMAGFPHQSLEKSLSDLVAKGHRVAICEAAADSPPKILGPEKQPQPQPAAQPPAQQQPTAGQPAASQYAGLLDGLDL